MPSINIRISKAEKERLAKVAETAGLTLSAFLRSAAIKEAHKVLGPPKLVKPRKTVEPSPELMNALDLLLRS